MSPGSTGSSTSSNQSTSSNKMISFPASPPPSPHPFLPPSRASTITSWTTTLPERSSRPRSASEVDVMSRDAAIEAYQKLMQALFSKAQRPESTQSQRPTS
ncbi:hypothetical protein CC78DRAFT_574960 [Lojkania enalia]|uniref:Uncharacterized protein n=1 Tax=Lojkania enalia TaxID=147567 RepID=A0A9P4NA21_9PLEO|nr:hypothetical protein CC78DRAFT_574960 [Didymosphaeria enalia]